MNEVRLTARLTKDPELRQAGQSRVCQFSLAWNTGKGDRKQSNFIDAKAWNAVGAELCEKYVKGNEITVRGFLTQEVWDDKNGGGKRSKIVLVVMAIKDDADGDDDRSEPAPARTVPVTNARSGAGGYANRSPSAPPPGDIDVPF